MSMRQLPPGLGDVVASRKHYMIYLVLDTSLSMREPLGGASPSAERGEAPLTTFIRLIPEMLRELGENRTINTLASVSVIAFDDTTKVLRPMSGLGRPAGIPEPTMGDGTDYRDVLHFIADNYDTDVRSVRNTRRNASFDTTVARPLIFFITDGVPFSNGVRQPPAQWLPARDALVSLPIEARIASIGLEGSEGDVLWQLATGEATGLRNAFIANSSENAVALVESTVEAIKKSITASVGAGTMIIGVPQGMRRIEPVRDV